MGKDKYRIREKSGEPGVYEVDSLTHTHKPYTVDLFELMGNGICNCTDYQTRCHPNWEKNCVWDEEGILRKWKIVDYGVRGRPNKSRTQCKHIKLTRHYFLTNLLETLYWKHRASEDEIKNH